MLKYKLLKEMISYKLLKGVFLSLLNFDEDNFVFLFINDTGSRTYLGGTQVSNFLCLVGSRTSQEVLLPPFFELVGNQTTQSFPTSQEVLLLVLLLRIKRPLILYYLDCIIMPQFSSRYISSANVTVIFVIDLFLLEYICSINVIVFFIIDLLAN